MSEYHYFLNGDTLPPPKFIPSPTGPILIFGSYNTRGFFHSERVFKNFGDLPSSSHLSSIHLKNISVDARTFCKQLRKIDVSKLQSVILENVSLSANSKFLSVELPSLKKYVLQVSHPFGEDHIYKGLVSTSNSNRSKEVISAQDILSLLFFERAKCKRVYSWKEDPQFELDKDIKIMFNNLLHFETRLEERLLYTCADPSEEIISMYNKSPLAKIILHRLDANSCILKRILPSCLKFLELTSMSWDQVEYFITNDCTSLEELVFGSFCSGNGPFAPTAVTMRISTLPKNLKRLSVSVVVLWCSNPSSTYTLDSLTIHNSKLETTFKNSVLEKLAPKKLLFLGTHKFLGYDFLSKLLQDDRVSSLYVESDCVDWDGDGMDARKVLELKLEKAEAMEKLWNFVQTKKRSEFETFYSGIGPPYPIFLERERFSNPFAYLMAPNPGKEKWIMREGFCGENIWIQNSYQGFPSDDQRRWRDPVTRTEQMEGDDGYYSLRYANIEPQTEIQLRLVDVWKSDLDIKKMKRVDLIGMTMQEEEIGQLFEQVGSNLETFVFEDIRVRRLEPQHPKLPCEAGFFPRSYIPMDLSLLPNFVKNLTFTNTWVKFGSGANANLPRKLGGLSLYGRLDATFWTLNLSKYFKCKVLILGSERLRAQDKAKLWWDPVTTELLSEAGKTGAEFILVYGYKHNTSASQKLRHMNGYSGWERDFLLVREEYSNSFATIRLDSKVTKTLLGLGFCGKFKELEDNFKKITKYHEESKKVRVCDKLPSSDVSPFVMEYRLESEKLPDDNKWPKKIKPVEFFGFGIYSRLTKLTSIYMYNVKINPDNFIKQLSRPDIDTSGLERIEILCTHLEGKFPDALQTPLDFPALKKFVFKLRSNAVMDIISMGRSKYSTWNDIQPFFFFTKKGKQLIPENLIELGIDLEVSYFDEKIIYYNSEDGKLICLLENYNQILDDHYVGEEAKLVTLGIKSNVELIHKFPINIRSLFLDVLDLAWDHVEVLISDLPYLESLYFHGQPGTTCTLKKLPGSLKSLEIASSATYEHAVIDFDLETPVHLDFISFSGCTLARPEVRYDLSSFIVAKKYRIDCDDYYSVGAGYKLISVLLGEAVKLGIEEISWINRNFNDIPESKDERWEQCRREERSLSWQEFEEIEALVGMAEDEVEKSGGASSSSRGKQGASSSSFGQISASITDIDGQEYKDWLQLVKNHKDGKWRGKKVARVLALEEVWFTSEISFDPAGKRTMKLIELNL